MITLKSTKLIAVDIDETLVMWKGDSYTPHNAHIELIKRFHKRGHTLIAWSQGGAEWASRVVSELGLEEYFFMAMGKVDWFVDDKPSSEFMPESIRIYLEDGDSFIEPSQVYRPILGSPSVTKEVSPVERRADIFPNPSYTPDQVDDCLDEFMVPYVFSEIDIENRIALRRGPLNCGIPYTWSKSLDADTLQYRIRVRRSYE